MLFKTLTSLLGKKNFKHFSIFKHLSSSASIKIPFQPFFIRFKELNSKKSKPSSTKILLLETFEKIDKAEKAVTEYEGEDPKTFK